MIILSYGMVKSGSTLAFELCKAVLEKNGYEQRRLPDEVVAEGHHINFLTDITVVALERAMAELSITERIAIKLHTPIGENAVPFVEKCIAEGAMKVQVNYRDPREICLSLVDAGAHAREKSRKAFSEVHTLEDAATTVRRQLAFCRHWGSIRGASFLFYNDVAFNTRKVVDELCSDFGFERFDDEDYNIIVNSVFNDTFTQKNKAIKDRYKTDLTVRQNEFLLSEMKAARDFIHRVCEKRDYSWFTDARVAEAEGD